jgi:hypothetical protein
VRTFELELTSFSEFGTLNISTVILEVKKYIIFTNIYIDDFHTIGFKNDLRERLNFCKKYMYLSDKEIKNSALSRH